MLSIAEVFCLAVFSIGMPRAEFACKNMETVIDTSHKYDIRPELLIGLIWTESGWNHEAVSNAGACGLTQVLPKYTKNPKLSCKELKDPTKSITTGGKIFNFWLDKYSDGHERTALCGYFAGFRCKGKSKNKWGYNRYAKKVLKRADAVLKAYNEELRKQKKSKFFHFLDASEYYKYEKPERWRHIEQ